jgi:hypothetical protein
MTNSSLFEYAELAEPCRAGEARIFHCNILG